MAKLQDVISGVLKGASEGKTQGTRIPTGLKEVDSVVGGGLRPGSLTCIVTDKGGCETAKGEIALGVTLSASRYGAGVLVLALEEDRESTAINLLARHANVPRQVFGQGTSDQLTPESWARIAESARSLAKTRLWLGDRARGLHEIRELLAGYLSNEPDGPHLVVITELALLREWPSDGLARELKLLARDRDLAILATMDSGGRESADAFADLVLSPLRDTSVRVRKNRFGPTTYSGDRGTDRIFTANDPTLPVYRGPCGPAERKLPNEADDND